ncbi:splicing regulatory glutamine/lysine-rich protein 1-like [Lepisosteus oculatus]|uniref:splicing regulatory glutamine/lysine-rich protein 1-like n=1 Tax=Lepisosteus oculatus TaxID=7918 RepID=UPI00371F532D
MDRKTEKRTERWTEKRTESQKDREKNRKTEGQKKTEKQKDRWTEGQDREKERKTEGQRKGQKEKDRWTEKRTERKKDRWTEKRTERHTKGQKDREKDRWIEGQTDRRRKGQTDRLCPTGLVRHLSLSPCRRGGPGAGSGGGGHRAERAGRARAGRAGRPRELQLQLGRPLQFLDELGETRRHHGILSSGERRKHNAGGMRSRDYAWTVLCPPGSGLIRKFYFVDSPLSWANAQRHCRDNCTDLASINSTADMDTVLNTTNLPSGTAWIGLYRDCRESWRWSGGELVTFTHWRSQLPCAVLNAAGFWEERDCSEEDYFICESQGINLYLFN